MKPSFILLCAFVAAVLADVDLGVNNGKRYTLVTTKLTWQAAQQAALQTANTKLATPLSKAETDYLISKLNAAMTATSTGQDGNLRVWLGCTDAAVEGTWVCQNGPNLAIATSNDVNAYPNWACLNGAVQPATRAACTVFRPQTDNTKNCLAQSTEATSVGAAGTWDDVNCATTLFYVTEVPVCLFNSLVLNGATVAAGSNAGCIAGGVIPQGGICVLTGNANVVCNGNAVCGANGLFNTPCATSTCTYSSIVTTGISSVTGVGCQAGGVVASGVTCAITAATGYTCVNPVCNNGVFSTLTPCTATGTALPGTRFSITFQGSLSTFNVDNAKNYVAAALDVSASNVAVLSVAAGSVVVKFQLTGLSTQAQQVALSKLSARCATTLAQNAPTGINADCSSIRQYNYDEATNVVSTSCDYNDLFLPSGVTAAGPGCGANLFVESGNSCILSVSNSNLLFCHNPGCDAGQWTTLYPCRAIDQEGSSLTGGTIAGIVIGCVLGVVGLVIVIIVAIACTAPPKHAAVDTP